MIDSETEDVGHDEAERAFVKSENHEFLGAKLQPYSMARRAAAQAIGLRYGALDSAHLARWSETSVYPGALRDVAVVLWLCTLSDTHDIDRAARDPVKGADDALKWFESIGIVDTKSDKFLDAYILFYEILTEIEKSRTEPQKKTATQTDPTKHSAIQRSTLTT